MVDVISTYSLVSPNDKQRWVVVYPAYINAKKTQAQGRKVPKSKAVDVPQVMEMRDVLTSKGFNVEIEAKQYPREHSRDHFMSGRIRVQLLDTVGSPVNHEHQTRKDLLYLLCELIPKLKTRYSRGAEGNNDTHQSSQSSNKKKRKHK